MEIGFMIKGCLINTSSNVPTLMASKRNRRYWLMTAGCAFKAVTVRTAPRVSVARPPAAAYCPVDIGRVERIDIWFIDDRLKR